MSNATEERASESPLPRTDSTGSTPNGGLNSHGAGYFSIPFERFVKDELSDFASGFTLLGEYHL